MSRSTCKSSAQARRRLTSIGLLCALVQGCAGFGSTDDQATVSAGSSPIAVGAYYPLYVQDACRGGGKGSFCTTETVVSIDEMVVKNPRVAEVFPIEEIPAHLYTENASWVVLGVGAGDTTVSITATFSDGSTRSGEAPISVQRATRSEVRSCELVGPGAEVGFVVTPLSGQTKLVGLIDGFLEGSGLTQHVADLQSMRYTWVAPAEPGTVRLESQVLPAASMEFRVFAADELVIESLIPLIERPSPVTLRKGLKESFTIRATVDGEVPCVGLPALPYQVTSLSPDVCSGPSGQLEWEESFESLRILPLQSGTCRVSVEVIGGSSQKEFSISYEVIE